MGETPRETPIANKKKTWSASRARGRVEHKALAQKTNIVNIKSLYLTENIIQKLTHTMSHPTAAGSVSKTAQKPKVKKSQNIPQEIAIAKAELKDRRNELLKLLNSIADSKNYDWTEGARDYLESFSCNIEERDSLAVASTNLRKARDNVEGSIDSELMVLIDQSLEAARESSSERLLRTDNLAAVVKIGDKATKAILAKTKKAAPSIDKIEEKKRNEACSAFEEILAGIKSAKNKEETGLTTKLLQAAQKTLSAVSTILLVVNSSDPLEPARSELVKAYQSLETLQKMHTVYDKIGLKLVAAYR